MAVSNRLFAVARHVALSAYTMYRGFPPVVLKEGDKDVNAVAKVSWVR